MPHKKQFYVPGLISLIGLRILFFFLGPEDPIYHTAVRLNLPADKGSSNGNVSFNKVDFINRFSEGLNMLIEPLAEGGITVNQTSLKDNAVKFRKGFYEWLKDNLKIPGIIAVERDTEFDDERYYRSGGIRLQYQAYNGSLEGVKDGILLEAGFSKVAPQPTNHHQFMAV